MFWILVALVGVLAISLFFDVYFWFQNIYHKQEQDRLEQEMVDRLEAVSQTFSDFKTDVDTALTHVEERTAKFTDPTQREQQIATEIKERWQVAMLEQANQFDTELKAAYKKACDSIAFQVIEYKKTIQKGRKKAYAAKNTPRASKFRSIDDK